MCLLSPIDRDTFAIFRLSRHGQRHDDGEPSSRVRQNTPPTIALCCTQCNTPLAAATDLLTRQIPRLESASYPYQLDLLGHEDAWVYSATNPHDARFDVCRVGGQACARVRVRGSATLRVTTRPSFPEQEACLVGITYIFVCVSSLPGPASRGSRRRRARGAASAVLVTGRVAFEGQC